jgi:hypothetical protein
MLGTITYEEEEEVNFSSYVMVPNIRGEIHLETTEVYLSASSG